MHKLASQSSVLDNHSYTDDASYIHQTYTSLLAVRRGLIKINKSLVGDLEIAKRLMVTGNGGRIENENGDAGRRRLRKKDVVKAVTELRDIREVEDEELRRIRSGRRKSTRPGMTRVEGIWEGMTQDCFEKVLRDEKERLGDSLEEHESDLFLPETIESSERRPAVRSSASTTSFTPLRPQKEPHLITDTQNEVTALYHIVNHLTEERHESARRLGVVREELEEVIGEWMDLGMDGWELMKEGEDGGKKSNVEALNEEEERKEPAEVMKVLTDLREFVDVIIERNSVVSAFQTVRFKLSRG